jgi:hypothetical protein
MHNVMPLTPFAHKMCSKLKVKGLQCPLLPTPCWHIDEETHLPINLNI